MECIAAEALDSAEKAAVDPTVAGIAAAATAEAVAMEEASLIGSWPGQTAVVVGGGGSRGG